jgi:sugar phosphate isomerase/epimerase
MSKRKIGMATQSTLIDGNLQEFEKEITFYDSIGIKNIEIGIHGIDGIINGKVNDNIIKKALNILKNYNFIISIHCPDNLNLREQENIEKQKKVFTACLEASIKMHSRLIVYHLGRENEDNYNKIEPKKYSYLTNKEIEYLSEFAEIAKSNSIQICVENNYDKKPPDELIEIINRINHPNVGICCDFGHAFISLNGDEEKFLDFVKMALPYLKHIHIHDNFGIFSGEKDQESNYRFLLPYGIGDLHMPPGMGRIPYNKVSPLLKDYKGIDMMEIRYRYQEMFPEILEQWENYFDF